MELSRNEVLAYLKSSKVCELAQDLTKPESQRWFLRGSRERGELPVADEVAQDLIQSGALFRSSFRKQDMPLATIDFQTWRPVPQVRFGEVPRDLS